MSITCGFFNSVKKDRMYNATHFGHCFDGIILDGILASIGDCFVVKAAGGMNITVGSGKSWYLASWLENDADLPMTHAVSDVVLSRIDAVVMEFDTTESVRWNDVKIIQGTASSAPERPTLVNTKTKVQIPLAYVSVDANSSEITQADITSVIGTDACPFVTGILQTVSLDTLLGQWDAELDQFVISQETTFSEWFSHIKSQLNDDAAGNLQNQIDKLQKMDATVALSADSWEGEVAPYTQTIALDGILATDCPHYGVVYSGELADKLAQYEAFSVVHDLETADGTLTFICFEEKPTVDLTIQIEVNR